MKILLCVVLASCVVGGCSHINKYFGVKDDSLIEEYIESLIEDQILYDIDLTPESKE